MRSFALHSYGVGELFHFGGRFLTYMSLERSWILRMRLAALACSQQDMIESHQSIERVGIPPIVSVFLHTVEISLHAELYCSLQDST